MIPLKLGSESYDLRFRSTKLALKDCGLTTKVFQAFVGYVFGDSTSGQRALYHVGMTGSP